MQNNKPETFNADLNNLPEALNELKLIPNWVLWKWEKTATGKWTKPPYQPNDSYANISRPDTWTTYDDVVEAYNTGEFDGIGFNILNSKFAALDLDDCRDPVSGTINDFAQDIIEQVDSYYEVSPSGTGIRIIGVAIGGKVQKINPKIEIYRAAPRYITITGLTLNGATNLKNIDASIDILREAKNDDSNNNSSSNNLIPLREIMAKKLEPIKWILPQYITEGCTLFAGRPKIGKSWLVLQLAMAVSSGDKTLDLQCESGDVLYCALEDNDRRIQFRVKKLKQAGAKYDMDHITIAYKMPRIGNGAKRFIKDWAETVQTPRLVIIDCLARIREPAKGKQTAYDNDYAAMEELQDIANKHGDD